MNVEKEKQKMNGNYTYQDGIVVNASDSQRADEKHERIKKCEHCGGTGLVQIAPNVRGLKKCPFCGGKLAFNAERN